MNNHDELIDLLDYDNDCTLLEIGVNQELKNYHALGEPEYYVGYTDCLDTAWDLLSVDLPKYSITTHDFKVVSDMYYSYDRILISDSESALGFTYEEYLSGFQRALNILSKDGVLVMSCNKLTLSLVAGVLVGLSDSYESTIKVMKDKVLVKVFRY